MPRRSGLSVVLLLVCAASTISCYTLAWAWETRDEEVHNRRRRRGIHAVRKLHWEIYRLVLGNSSAWLIQEQDMEEVRKWAAGELVQVKRGPFQDARHILRNLRRRQEVTGHYVGWYSSEGQFYSSTNYEMLNR